MHVHLPKPIHGWRQFFGEVGIIVIGVLIALAFEQVVEWAHWHHVVHQDEEVLNGQVEGYYGAMLARVDQQACVDQRLSDLRVILARHDAGEPLGITGPVGRLSAFGGDDSAFEMAIADQSLAHMSLASKQRFYDARGSYKTFIVSQDIEMEAWRTLRTVDRQARLSPSDWSDIAKVYDRAVDVNGVMKTNLTTTDDTTWLTPFGSFEKPTDVSLRSLPWVKQLCAGTVIGKPEAGAKQGG